LQQRPGEVEGLLLPLADRLYHHPIIGTGQSVATAGAAARQTHGRGTVRQPEEHCATSAGELASASLAGGQLRCGPSGGAPHRSGGHLVGGRAFLSLRVSLSIGKPVTPCGDRPACALDSVAGARNNGQPITANGDSSFLGPKGVSGPPQGIRL